MSELSTKVYCIINLFRALCFITNARRCLFLLIFFKCKTTFSCLLLFQLACYQKHTKGSHRLNATRFGKSFVDVRVSLWAWDSSSKIRIVWTHLLNSFLENDSSLVYGKHIANKLRTVSALQNKFAQKLINDIVFEAEMGSLTRGCTLAGMDNAELW